MLKCTVNSNFHLIRSKTLPTNDFELTVPNLYNVWKVVPNIPRMETSFALLEFAFALRGKHTERQRQRHQEHQIGSIGMYCDDPLTLQNQSTVFSSVTMHSNGTNLTLLMTLPLPLTLGVGIPLVSSATLRARSLWFYSRSPKF